MRRLALLSSAILALGLAGGALAVPCPGPDAFGHECENDPPGCGPIAAAFSPVPGMFDDSCTTRGIGFSFDFYGSSYTSVGVASNGYLRMGGCAAGDGTDFTNDCPVPSTIDPDDSVFGLWDDLNPANGGTVGDATVGSAPNRTYVVDYNNVPFFSNTPAATFQIQLHENGGDGESVSVWIGSSTQTDYTSGLEGPAGSDGIARFCNNGATSDNCTNYLVPGGGGDPPTGDLAEVLAAIDAVEAKLDSNLDVAVSSRASQASVDALEVKLDALQTDVDGLYAGQCEVIRLLHTPQGIRTSSTAECGDFSWNDGGAGE